MPRCLALSLHPRADKLLISQAFWEAIVEDGNAPPLSDWQRAEEARPAAG